MDSKSLSEQLFWNLSDHTLERSHIGAIYVRVFGHSSARVFGYFKLIREELEIMDFSKYQAQQRVLVVEDDRWMQPLITAAIRAAIPGALIDWVESAEDAIRSAHRSTYAVILSDIYLRPNRENGIDLWKVFRDLWPEIPIILMSSIPVDTFSKNMGMYGPYYLLKPFSAIQCKDTIKSLVSHHGLSS